MDDRSDWAVTDRSTQETTVAAAQEDVPPRPQVLSFFCGAGGLDLGFSDAGYEIVFAADYDQAAVDTHNKNSGVPTARQLDISQIGQAELKSIIDGQSFLIEPVGVIGGPPCQGFSRANTQRSADDPRNNLAYRYAELVIELADAYPIQFFVLENVPELLAQKNNSVFQWLNNKLSERFNVSVQLINAADFGVPQTRQRLFMVGIRGSINSPERSFVFPSPLAAHRRTVRDAIWGLPSPVFFDKSLTPNDIPYHPNHWTMRPKSTRFSENLVSSGRSLIRLDWDKPSRTVAYGHREIHVHPTGLRRLSIYEAMLLQGFPSSYKLSGNLSQQVTQVSNAVPPPVAKAIANQLRAYLTVNKVRRFR